MWSGAPSFDAAGGKRALWKVHSGALEAHALLLTVRHITRRSGAHGKRVPCLVDAQTVVAASAKGRSSAPTLRRTLARAGAFVLAANIGLRVIYTPSEANPADGPSRWYARL